MGAAMAAEPELPANKLRVGVYEHPPFVILDGDGNWDGLAVDLWRLITTRTNIDYEFIDVDPARAIDDLQLGRIDVLLGQMSVSAAQDRRVDFSHAFLVEPLAAAFDRQTLFPHWTEFIQGLPSHGVFSVLAVGLLGLLAFAILFWLAERGRANSHFAGHPIQALGSALWFSAVTMTTVGYGDKTPLTPLGRALALLWMFVGILLISGFTATVASTVAASRTATAVLQLSDLSRFENGVVEDSLAGVQLRNAGIAANRFTSVDSALDAVKEKKIHAFVADMVTIRYELNQPKWSNLRAAIMHDTSTRMAIPVRPGLPELPLINVGLLETLEGVAWQGVLRRWTGSSLSLTM
jgi:ABC-type amino acid transport substrate-binding protein